MKFSIVVPTYNEERDIASTLDRLVALDWSDYEVLVVDDSIDRTPDIVLTYADQGVRLIRPENARATAAPKTHADEAGCGPDLIKSARMVTGREANVPCYLLWSLGL